MLESVINVINVITGCLVHFVGWVFLQDIFPLIDFKEAWYTFCAFCQVQIHSFYRWAVLTECNWTQLFGGVMFLLDLSTLQSSGSVQQVRRLDWSIWRHGVVRPLFSVSKVWGLKHSSRRSCLPSCYIFLNVKRFEKSQSLQFLVRLQCYVESCISSPASDCDKCGHKHTQGAGIVY